MLETSANCFTVYHSHYMKNREMTEFAYKFFFLWSPPRLAKSAHNYFLFRSLQNLLFLLGASSHYIIKIINPLTDMPDISKHWFAIYLLHYKNKQVSNSIWTSICAVNYLYFRYNLCNFLTALFLLVIAESIFLNWA